MDSIQRLLGSKRSPIELSARLDNRLHQPFIWSRPVDDNWLKQFELIQVNWSNLMESNFDHSINLIFIVYGDEIVKAFDDFAPKPMKDAQSAFLSAKAISLMSGTERCFFCVHDSFLLFTWLARLIAGNQSLSSFCVLWPVLLRIVANLRQASSTS